VSENSISYNVNVMKKTLAFALAVIVACSMYVTAFASTDEAGTGTIEFTDGDAPIIVEPNS